MSTATKRRLRKPMIGAFALLSASALVLAGCAGGGGDSGSAEDPATLEFLKNAENTTTEPVLQALADGVCSDQEEAMPLEINSIPQADLDAQVQLLATQDGLPPMFSAGGNPAEGAKLWEAGYLLDFDEALTDLGVRDKIAEGAVSTIEKLYGGSVQLPAVPVQHRGHLLQQGDLRGERLGRSRDVGRPPDRRSRRQGRRRSPRSPLPASRAGRSRVWSAATCSARSAPTPCRRSPTATRSSPTPSTSRPRRRSPTSVRRATSASNVASLDYDAAHQRVPHRQGRDDLHGQLAAGQHQRRRQPDRRGQRRVHAVPRRRRRRGLDRGVPVQRRPARHLRREDLQPGRRRVAEVHHRELRQRGAQAGSDHRLHRR